MAAEPFTRLWRRPSAAGGSATANNEQPVLPVAVCGCLVCGGLPSDGSKLKKCSRCFCASYCSQQCQLTDHGDGQHKNNCKILKKLWAEKEELEDQLFSLDTPATVGHFFHEQPTNDTEILSSNYYICLLNIVQVLARDEGWRMKKTTYYRRSLRSESVSGPSKVEVGNPLALSVALDIGLNLLYLERADLRARILIPPIYIELGMLQEAYDYVKFWIQPKSTEMIMDLVTTEITATEAVSRPYLDLVGEDMAEGLEEWVDFDMLYTSCGMVFELALIKLKLAFAGNQGDNPEELKRQARLLLSAVHKLNANLLPPLGHWDRDSGQPAAVQELLQQQRPGCDLRCRMGNAGGRSVDEAVAIWQRDMVIWDSDREAMSFLASFCSNLDGNLVDLPSQIDDADGKRREEAETLAQRLQRERPDLSVDAIMMHPEMAALMAKHLQESRAMNE